MQRLAAVMPESRLVRYAAACAGTGINPLSLHEWNAELSMAVFRDIAIVEIILRSRMADRLGAHFGPLWMFDEELLDDPAVRAVARVADDRHGGRRPADEIIAAVSLGFWVRLLGRGGHRTVDGARRRRIYDTLLWRTALSDAFSADPPITRTSVESAARTVQVIRNRIAHHEPLIWGIPIADRRLALHDGHAAVLDLARMLDPGFGSWLRDTSPVSPIIERCPIAATALRL
jgi:hypothetical protein